MAYDGKDARPSRKNKVADGWIPSGQGTLVSSRHNESDEKRNSGKEPVLNDSDSKATVRCRYHETFLIFMASVGLFHPFNFKNCGGRWRAPLGIYSTLIMLFMAFNMVRNIATVFDQHIAVNNLFFAKVTTLTWTCLVTANFIIHYAVCFNRKHGIAGYYAKLDKAVAVMRFLDIDISWRGCRQFEVGCLVVSVLIIVANLALTIPSLLFVKSSDMMAPFLRLQPGNATTQYDFEAMGYVMAVNYAFGVSAWIFPVSYVLVISKQICTLFDSFNRAFEETVTSRPSVLLDSIGSYRLAYCHIKKIVSFVDGYFKIVYCLHFTAYLGLSMLQLYMLVSPAGNGSSAMLAQMIEWFSASVVILIFEFAASCRVALVTALLTVESQFNQMRRVSCEKCVAFHRFIKFLRFWPRRNFLRPRYVFQ